MRGRLATIDLLRGVAILLVINHHMFGGFVPIRLLTDHPLILAIPANGAYGVNLFFILSGFVLFLPHLRTPRSLSAFDVWRFYRRRAERLLPLYYLSVWVAFLMYIGWSRPPTGNELWELALVCTFLFQFSQRHFFPKFNHVLWSLAIEVSFSLLLPFLAMTCLRIGMLRPLIAAVVIAMLTRWMGSAGSPVIPVVNSVAGRLDNFVVGMAAAWLFVRCPPTLRPLACIASGVVLIQLTCMASDPWTSQGQGFLRVVLLPEFLNVGCFVLLRGMLAPSFAPGWRAIQLIGRMSYSLYLWHVVVKSALFAPFEPHSPAKVALYFVLVFGLSAATYRFVEFRREPDWRKLFLIPKNDCGVYA